MTLSYCVNRKEEKSYLFPYREHFIFIFELTVIVQLVTSNTSLFKNLISLQVRRIQNIVETLDSLKALNSNPFIDNSSAVSATTAWETFDSGSGNLNAPFPNTSSATINNDWEHFD